MGKSGNGMLWIDLHKILVRGSLAQKKTIDQIDELMGVKKCTRVHGPSTRPVNSGNGNRALE